MTPGPRHAPKSKAFFAALDAKDSGFMYGWSFYDLYLHRWEVGCIASAPV